MRSFNPLADVISNTGVKPMSMSAFAQPKIDYSLINGSIPQRRTLQPSSPDGAIAPGALQDATQAIDNKKLKYSMDRTCGTTDCSAFTQNIYKKAYGKDIGAWTGTQQKAGNSAALGDSKYGDLVFFNTDGGKRTGGASHVGYDNGNGTFTHFSSGNGGGVKTSPFAGYYPVVNRRRL